MPSPRNAWPRWLPGGRRTLLGLALIGGLTPALPPPIPGSANDLDSADDPPAGFVRPADPFGDVPILAKADLVGMRGGFINAAGLMIEFGANVRTFIDGIPVLEAVITFTDVGFVTQQTIPHAASGPAMPGLSLVVGDGSGTPLAQVTPPGLDLSALAEASGVVLNGDDGFTAALHNIVSDQILNVIVTTGSERAIEQQIDVIVTIENFSQFRQDAAIGLLNRSLTDPLH